MAGGKKLTGNLRREIDNRKGESTAQKYFAKKGMIRDEDFSLIWWDGMEQLMRAYPKNVPCLAYKTCLRLLWHQQTDVLLEKRLERSLLIMLRSCRECTTHYKVQRQGTENDIAPFS